jgi:hypothetical protein
VDSLGSYGYKHTHARRKSPAGHKGAGAPSEGVDSDSVAASGTLCPLPF